MATKVVSKQPTTLHKCGYDAFGGVRSTQGVAADATGGDFRFQGQWLESATGIYHFRARDYDSRTGTFLSRDPVDPNEQQPEAMNPYQAMYNNPYMYSDATGMFTISEFTSGQQIQKILEGIKVQAGNQARQYFIDRAKGITGDILQSVIKQLLPADSAFLSVDILQRLEDTDDGAAGRKFEQIVQDKVCEVISGSFQRYSNSLWLEPRVGVDGKPLSDGFNCGDTRRPTGYPAIARNPRPDFIIKNGGPRTTDHARSSRFPKAYLIGDIKVSGNAMKETIGSTQWDAIMNYAAIGNNHQYAPVALYITFTAPTVGQRQKVQKEAMEKGVSAAVVSIFPRFGKRGNVLPS